MSWYGTKEVTLPLGAEFHRRRLRIRSTQVSTIAAALAGRWTVAYGAGPWPGTSGRAAARRAGNLRACVPRRHRRFQAAVDEGAAGLLHAALWYT